MKTSLKFASLIAALTLAAGAAHADPVPDMQTSYGVGALAMAVNSADYKGSLDAGDNAFSAGMGAFGGQNAVAMGYTRAVEQNVTVNVKAATLSGLTSLGAPITGGTAWSIGAGFKF